MSQPAPVRASIAEQARAWLAIGMQSIGGGAATLFLMRRTFLRRGWVSPADFTDDWALSRVSPGIHMTALAALLGRRFGGRRGIAVAVVGLLGPSAFITIALTAGFDAIRDIEVVQRVFTGMGATALGLAIGTQLRLVRTSMRGGRVAVLDGSVAAAAFGIGLLFPASPLLAILAGTVFGTLLLGSSNADGSRGTPVEPDPG